jgi:hypothetical protein
VIVTDATFLPRLPQRMRNLFDLAHREPLMFVAAAQDKVHSLRQYLGQDPIYHLLSLPYDAEGFAFDLGRALHHRRQTTDYRFFRDVLFLLCGGLPLFVLMVVLVAQGAR